MEVSMGESSGQADKALNKAGSADTDTKVWYFN